MTGEQAIAQALEAMPPEKKLLMERCRRHIMQCESVPELRRIAEELLTEVFGLRCLGEELAASVKKQRKGAAKGFSKSGGGMR